MFHQPRAICTPYQLNPLPTGFWGTGRWFDGCTFLLAGFSGEPAEKEAVARKLCEGGATLLKLPPDPPASRPRAGHTLPATQLALLAMPPSYHMCPLWPMSQSLCANAAIMPLHAGGGRWWAATRHSRSERPRRIALTQVSGMIAGLLSCVLCVLRLRQSLDVALPVHIE